METRKIHFSRVPIIANYVINNNKPKIKFFSFNGRIKYLSISKHLNIIFFYFSISGRESQNLVKFEENENIYLFIASVFLSILCDKLKLDHPLF